MAIKRKPKPKTSDDPIIHRTGTCTREVVEEFCDYLLEGLPADSCCDMLGINPSTFHRWIRLGEEYLASEKSEQVKAHRIFAYFVTQFRRAVAEYKLARVRKLHTATGRKWYRELAILERRDRATYGRYEQQGGNTQDFDPDDRFL